MNNIQVKFVLAISFQQYFD